MIHLVTGGSGSGKSEYAENWLTGRNKKDGTYIYHRDRLRSRVPWSDTP